LILYYNEAFEKYKFLFEFKEGENFNHPRGICFAFHRAGTKTGQEGLFFKGLIIKKAEPSFMLCPY
jgi:hypothetical protein